MKNLIILPFLLLMLGFVSCDEVKNLTIQDVSAPINIDFNIQSADTNQISKVDSLDASSNTNFMDNRSKIENLEIDAIQYKVSSLDGGAADTMVNGKLEVKNPGTGNFETLCTFTNKRMIFNLLETASFDPNVANLLVASVKNSPYRSTLRYQATMNKKPVGMVVQFTVRLKLKVKV
jgi:hypothetical protein